MAEVHELDLVLTHHDRETPTTATAGDALNGCGSTPPPTHFPP
jgi:hypothetical protein